MSDDVNPSMEALLEQLDLSDLFEDDDSDKDQVNFWIPAEYKLRFKKIQSMSKKKFGQKVQNLIMMLIDKVDPKSHSEIS